MTNTAIILIMIIIMYVIGMLVGMKIVPAYVGTLAMSIIGFLTGYLF